MAIGCVQILNFPLLANTIKFHLEMISANEGFRSWLLLGVTIFDFTLATLQLFLFVLLSFNNEKGGNVGLQQPHITLNLDDTVLGSVTFQQTAHLHPFEL